VSSDRTARLLNLVAALRDADRPLSAQDLRAQVPGYPSEQRHATFQRAFERDKDALRAIGVELEVVEIGSSDPPVAGYRIRRDRYELPDPGLTPQELAALHLAARSVRLRGIPDGEVLDALRKLGGVGASGPEDAGAPEVGSLAAPDELPEVFGAVVEHRELTFSYRGEPRRLRPDRLQFERGRWYVSGHDVDRAARRSFRLDRMAAASAGPPHAFEPPSDAGGVRLRPWEYGEGPAVQARVLLDAVAAQLVLGEHPTLPVEPADGSADAGDGSVVVTLEVRDDEACLSFLLTLLDRAVLIEPPELRAALIARLEELATPDPEGVVA
jgi:proteasome accessory factor B